MNNAFKMISSGVLLDKLETLMQELPSFHPENPAKRSGYYIAIREVADIVKEMGEAAVRCEDCIHWTKDSKGVFLGECGKLNRTMDGEWYCFYGERKEV